MSDRLEQLTDQVHALIKEKRDLKVEIDRLRANQIPGRCGECRFLDEKEVGSVFEKIVCPFHNQPKPESGFCHEWKPKE